MKYLEIASGIVEKEVTNLIKWIKKHWLKTSMIVLIVIYSLLLIGIEDSVQPIFGLFVFLWSTFFFRRPMGLIYGFLFGVLAVLFLVPISDFSDINNREGFTTVHIHSSGKVVKNPGFETRKPFPTEIMKPLYAKWTASQEVSVKNILKSVTVQCAISQDITFTFFQNKDAQIKFLEDVIREAAKIVDDDEGIETDVVIALEAMIDRILKPYGITMLEFKSGKG